MAIFIDAHFIFLQKNVMSGIFPYNLQWVVQAVNKCNQNRETKCVDKIKLRNLQILYKLFKTILSQKGSVIFATFSHLLLYFISNKQLPKL